MKRNRIIYVMIFLAVMLINIHIVKADGPVQYYITTEKENYEKNYGAYWTEGIEYSPVIKAKRGDKIKVVVAINEWSEAQSGLKLEGGTSTILWDCDAFELLATNGKYYDLSISDFNTITASADSSVNPNKYIGGITFDGTVLNHRYLPYTVEYEVNNEVIKDGISKILQYQFQVKKDIPDGIYSIKALYDYNGNTVNYAGMSDGVDDDIIYVQIGDNIYNPSLSVSPVDVPNNTYIIGKHMFTNNVTTAYKGQLTTEHIMRASKSFDSYDLSKMIIYYKNARGNWVNAINNKTVTPPETFDISFKDMVEYNSSNSFNGVYKGGFGEIIEIYDLPNNRAQLNITGYGHEQSGGTSSVYIEVNALRKNGKITFTYSNKNYSISKDRNNIILTTNNTTDFLSTEFLREGDYLEEQYLEDSFFGISGSFEENPYNAIYTGSKGNIYMFSDGNRENIVFITSDGTRIDTRLFINENGTLVSSNAEIYKFSYNAQNKEFTVTEYNGSGKTVANSKVTGTYKFSKYINKQILINELQYLDLNASIVISNS